MSADTRAYARKVRRSLLAREMLGGVPQIGLLALFIAAVLFVYGFSLYFMIIPIVLCYFVMRHLSRKDPWLIDIIAQNIQQKDVFIP